MCSRSGSFTTWFAAASLALAVLAASAHATTISIEFHRITNNSAEDPASQFRVDAMDAAAAFSAFGLVLGADQVLFAFHNDVGIASNISEVYFDDGTLFALSSVENSLGGFTNFIGGSASPGNLPAGNTVAPPFVATAGFVADTAAGPAANGVDAAADILGIVFALLPGMTIQDVGTALADGSLRIGLHVRSIGTRGDSDSFVNDRLPPVPEPGTLSLLAAGIAGLALLGRRRS